MSAQGPYDPRLVAYYETGVERDRLQRRHGALEFVRTQEILGRHLPVAPVRVLEVGGATGVYCRWLSAEGYDVHLVDPLAFHVAEARKAAKQGPRFEVAQADARTLPFGADTFDAVLLFGPLYHLLEADQRIAALVEARRVVRPGGLIACAVITRWAPLTDGLVDGWIFDPRPEAIVDEISQNGRATVPLEEGGGFGSIACFHRPEEILDEVGGAGLDVIELVGVEGPGWLIPDFDDRWTEAEHRRMVLHAAELVEREPSFMCVSPHLLCLARRRA